MIEKAERIGRFVKFEFEESEAVSPNYVNVLEIEAFNIFEDGKGFRVSIGLSGHYWTVKEVFSFEPMAVEYVRSIASMKF